MEIHDTPSHSPGEFDDLLPQLLDEDSERSPGARIRGANHISLKHMLSADPVWEDVLPARAIWPEMDEQHLLLHAGPPVQWEWMSGPMKGAVLGAIMLEGWAKDLHAATRMAETGEIRFEPCHHYGAVGPMAGIVSPSMPMFVVRNAIGHNVAYSSINEGVGKVLRYGAFGPEVLARLRWMHDVIGPTLSAGIQAFGGLRLIPIMTQALEMGDDLHVRNTAATAMLFKAIAPTLVRAVDDPERVAATLDKIADTSYFFLNLAMAACKTMLEAASGVPYSSVVTVMSRNGVEFGIQVSALGHQWFTAPVEYPVGVYRPGFTQDDAAGDMGDSAIIETAGLGGFVAVGAPAIAPFVGTTLSSAIANTQAMYSITVARNPALLLPALEFIGAPTGIDIRKVVHTGIQPIINTGIAHREAGIGQAGAGVVRAPMLCFTKALAAFAQSIFNHSPTAQGS